ncbi:MAG: glycosyltransferase family 2 protein [Rhodospirillales bacterium]|nr:glycosyltransferase family 2 protein [Rhodospirillales bacterium]
MPREVAPVSVIIPAYNAAQTIERALISVAAQSLPAAEVIVVDDGSRDGTAETAESMRSRLGETRLRVVRQENKGAGAARNRAVQEARETYLTFLDADDEWLPEKLARSMQVIQEGDYLLVAHDYLDATESGDVHVDCSRRFGEPPDPYTTLYLKGYIPSISVITKRDAVLAVGGFDERLRNAQDFDLWLKLLADPSTKFTLFGEALARYHHTEGSIMSHTDRRIACCREIALRYLPALKARGGFALPKLWRRLAIVHGEAARAQPERKWSFILKGAGALAWDTLYALSGDLGEKTPERPCGIMVCAAWMIAVLVLYLSQFQQLAGPIKSALGF